MICESPRPPDGVEYVIEVAPPRHHVASVRSSIDTSTLAFVGWSQSIDRFPTETDLELRADVRASASGVANVECVARNPKYIFEQVDLRDKSSVLRVVERRAINHVIHLAAESHVDRSITGPGDFIQTNIVGTFNLLEACRGAWNDNFADKRFHHVSTDEVYGSLGSTGYFTETTSYAPNSPYSASKASSDMLVRAYHYTYGLPMVITNYSNN